MRYVVYVVLLLGAAASPVCAQTDTLRLRGMATFENDADPNSTLPMFRHQKERVNRYNRKAARLGLTHYEMRVDTTRLQVVEQTTLGTSWPVVYVWTRPPSPVRITKESGPR